MTKHKLQKGLIIATAVGLVMYLAGFGWAKYTAANDIGVGANIGAGVLGLAGLSIGIVALFVFILVTLFKRH